MLWFLTNDAPLSQMMKPLRLLDWTVDADPEATRDVYRRIRIGGPESCGCVHCRNFIAARDEIYTNEILQAIAPLGIEPPFREAEISQTCRLESGMHIYCGWFFFIGQLRGGPKKRKVSRLRKLVGRLTQLVGGYQTRWDSRITHTLAAMAPLTDRFFVRLDTECWLVPEPFRELPLVRLEFQTEGPWLLDEPWET